jgi:hypothetical protein
MEGRDYMNVVEGDTIQIAKLGPVKVNRIFPSGACNVTDQQGRKWLVPCEVILAHEICLFSFVPDVREPDLFTPAKG